MDETQFRELKGFDWRTISRILTAYAVALLKFKKLRSINGKESKDYVQESITLLFEGKRKWNKKTTPDILDFLKSTVKSLISNDLTSKRQQTTSNITEENQESIENKHASTFTTEDEQICLDFKREIKAAVKGDQTLEIYVEFLDYGFEDEELAEACKITIQELKKAKRRLRTKVNKIKNNE